MREEPILAAVIRYPFIFSVNILVDVERTLALNIYHLWVAIYPVVSSLLVLRF